MPGRRSSTATARAARSRMWNRAAPPAVSPCTRRTWTSSRARLSRRTADEPGLSGGEIRRRRPFPCVDERQLILVVEDDEATRAFLADNLAADGFRVAGAAGAAEGLRAIEVRRPSLVLLDLALEGSSGLVLLDRVRSADGLASRIDPELPVMVLTGRSGEADRVRSFARGADDHVCKPFLYAELLGRI